MRRYLVCLSLLLLFVAATPAFAGDLNGATVTVNYLYPEQNDIYEVLGTGTVDAGGFTVNSFGQHDLTVYPDEITLTNVAGENINFTTADFNGYGLVVDSGGSPITGVTIAYNDIAGFTASDITFDGTDVWLNLEGLTTTPGLDLQLDLQFANGTTPEPSSLTLMGVGALTLLGAARRKLLP